MAFLGHKNTNSFYALQFLSNFLIPSYTLHRTKTTHHEKIKEISFYDQNFNDFNPILQIQKPLT